MPLKDFFLPTPENNHTPQLLQKLAMGIMLGLVLLSFATVNLQALLWQTSDWLVSTILPAVIVDLTNDAREKTATLPLRRSAVLDEAARLKAEHMAKNQYFAHYSPDGVSPWYWFDQVAYTYAHAGENLAIHFSDSGAVVEGWMNSPSHRANIVNNQFTEIGVGTAKGVYDGFETVYVVQLFGTPANPPPLLVSSPASPALVTPAPVPVAIAEALPAEVASVATTDTSATAQSVPEVIGVNDDPEIASSTISTASTDEETLALSIADAAQATTATATVVATEATELTPEESLIVADMTMERDVVSVYSALIATSSGLAPLTFETASAGMTKSHASVIGSLATRPSAVLQAIYYSLGLFVIVLLLTSITISLRSHRPWQVVYGVFLLLVMSSLFYVHVQLMTSVVVAATPVTDRLVMKE